MDAILEHQRIEDTARSYWRAHPEIREEFRHDLEFYIEFRIRRAGVGVSEHRPLYAGLD